MLPFKSRLIKRRDFDRVHKTGRFFSQDNIAIKAVDNGLRESRIGFVVGIKFSKRATERNIIKRQLRDIFRLFLSELRPGFDVVVMIRKKEQEKIKFEELKKNTEEVLKKSGLLKNNNQHTSLKIPNDSFI